MFQDSNIVLFLLCIAPVIFYSLAIFVFSPSFSIRLKTSFTYLYIGLLSVTLLQFLHFIFPHIHDTFLKIFMGRVVMNGEMLEIYQPTLASLVLFAFIQVALMEELSKWAAVKCVDYMRGKRRKNLDHPYSTMFYSALVAAAFAIVENIQYAQRAMSGDFGENVGPESVLISRAISSVIIHMCCGLFMGYYMGMAKGYGILKRITYNILGISSAAFMHGLYDFDLMKPDNQNDIYNLFGFIPVDISSVIIIGICLFIAFLMSTHLKYFKSKELSTQ